MISMTPEDLAALIRGLGSNTFATNPIEQVIAKTYVPELKPEEIIKPMSVLDDLTPEEILFYATPRYDEIQAEKEAHKQKLKEENNK